MISLITATAKVCNTWRIC